MADANIWDQRDAPAGERSGTGLRIPPRQETRARTWTGETEWYTPPWLLSSTLHIFPRSDHIATQKIGSLAMMCRASSSGATVWPNGPTGAQRRFHSDQ